MAGDQAAVMGELEVDGTYLIASAHKDKVALALPGEEHTAFTGRLLSLLREGVAGGPKLLTVDDLYRQMLAVMKREGLPSPQRRGTKTADHLPIVQNKAFALPSAQELQKRYRRIVAICRGGGKWAGSVDELSEVLAAQEAMLGEHDDDVIRTRQFYAHTIGAAGDPAEAVRQLEDLLAAQLQSIEPDHPAALETRHLLAVSLGEAGARSAAVAILRSVTVDRRRILGPGDEATWRSQHVLARNLAFLGVFEESIAHFKELLSLREGASAPNHRLTQITRRDLEEVIRRRPSKIEHTNV